MENKACRSPPPADTSTSIHLKPLQAKNDGNGDVREKEKFKKGRQKCNTSNEASLNWTKHFDRQERQNEERHEADNEDQILKCLTRSNHEPDAEANHFHYHGF